MRSRNRQKGYLLISVVVTLFLLSTIVMLLVYDSANNASSASSDLEAARAEYVARAGMQNALWRAQNNACLGDVTIPETSLGTSAFAATISGTATGSLVIVDSDQDAWIRNDDPDKNNGKTATNHVRFESGKIEQVLTRFDVSSISSKARIHSAVAWFHLKAGKEHPEGHIKVHEIRADWNEMSVTWGSFNGAYRPGIVGSIPAQDSGNTWVAVNITGLVQSWVNGQPNYGILFDSSAEGLHTEYTSREDGTNPPRLEIVVAAGAPSPATLQATGMLNSGIKRRLERTDVPALQPPTTIVLQPGPTDGMDTYTYEWWTSGNFGTDDETWVSRSNNNASVSLLRFAVDSIPQNARVTRATLSLHHRSGKDNGVPIGAYRVTRSWDEGSATWDNRMTGQSWTTAGGDIDSAPVDTISVSSPYSVRREWEIGPLVQGWVDGTYPNYGVALATFMADSDGEQFDTSDHADLSRRPSLTITFACECGTPCLVPNGSGRIALVGDDWTPDPDDQFKVQLLESWGYDVDFYQDRDSDGINWSNYDLAYISETAIAGDVHANLENLSIGVVNEEPNLYDDIRVASGATENVGSTIDIIDNGHFITSVFPIGPLSIYTGDMEILTADTPLAGGLQTLGEFGGKPTLATLDQGAEATSGTAAGRRVSLPFGQHFAAGFDWQHLNYNGHLLVQRSIDWAMGADATFNGMTVMFVVVNPNSLTTQESLKKAMMESWGYAISLIDESDSADEFQKLALNTDVVFISEDVTANNVGSKLNSVATGVVTEEANLADEFGFASNIGWDSGNKLSIDNGFYITQPFASGSLAILTTSESLAYLSGSISPDVKILGSSDSGAGLAVLQSGAQLAGGGAAAGRRAMLPWGGNNMDFGHLTNDGMTIFQRALEWAAGAGPKYGPIAHWKLNETSGTTAIDSVGGHDGTLVNGPIWAPGTVAGGLYFDGDDDYVDLGSNAELTDIFDGGATVTGWIYLRSWGESNNGRILDKASQISGDRDGWMIGVRGETPALQFAQGFTGTRGFWRSDAGTLALNNWVHFAVVYDASSVDNDAKIFLDGVEQSPLVEITPTGSIATDDGIALRMGNYAQDTSRTFEGVLDDVRIYERLLSSDEIEELAQRPAAAPVAHWEFDENSGSTAVDSLGGRVGTLTNGASWAGGALGSGVRFDGTNDRINVSHDNGLNLVSEMTLSAWIYADTLKPFQMVLTKGDNGVAENYWLATEGNKLNFGFIDGGLYAQYTSTSLVLEAGRWHHVAATFNNAADEVVLYVDGSSEIFSSTYTPAANDEQLIIGSSYYGGEAFDGVIDDVRIYNSVLGAQEVSDLAASGGGGGGGGATYVERNHLFTVSANNSWRTIDLSGQGVPPNAVVEIAMENTSGNREREAGIRAIGTSAPTYDLHEAEGGGVDALTKHVQADASAQIQAYAENSGDVQFRLLGYWTGGSYANTDGLFTSSTSNSWRLHNLTSFGIQPLQVVELIVQNKSGGSEYRGGVRKVGSGHAQMIDLQEAENGGKDFHSVFVETADNVSAAIEAYAESTGSIEFKPAGMWLTPPGTYIQHDAVIDIGGPTSNNTWQTVDLTAFGVPPNAVLQITLSNKNNSGERLMGVRSVGSSLDRYIELHEPESGGEDVVTMHVKADASSRIQWYHSRPSDPHRFHLMGWWVLN